MRDSLALYGRYLGVSVRAQMQYRASFMLTALGLFMVSGIEFLGIWALFDRFGSLRDWALAEVALFYGVVNVAFSIAEASARGFDVFSDFVKRGDFDRMLLRPRSTVLQLAGFELALHRIGRLAQGALVLGWASLTLDLDWTFLRLVLLGYSIACGTCLFFGLFVLQATAAFWTTDSLELANTMTYGGVQTAQYPLAIYGTWFRRFFTFVVPLAAIAYFPVVAILERPDPLGSPFWFQCAAPLLGPAFLLASLGLWQLGVRHYTSTGS